MTYALSRRTAAAVAALVAAAGATAVAIVTTGADAAMTPTASPAMLPGSNGKITYTVYPNTYIANADGSAPTLLAPNGRLPSWAPDGSRVAYVSTAPGSAGIVTARADGSAAVQVTTDSTDLDPAWTAGGERIVFSRQGKLLFAGSDGSWWGGPLGENDANPSVFTDVQPAISKQNTVVFVRQQQGVAPAIYQYQPSSKANPTLLVSNATEPDFSPDGTKIAYTVPAQPANGTQIWIADANGANPVQLTTDADGAMSPSWSPDGTSVLYTQATAPGTALPGKRIDVGSKDVTQVVPSSGQMSWQPVRKNLVERVWGQDGTDTAVATSQWNYADHGTSDPVRVPANAVVLSRSDTYLDALAGSALAVNRHAPLLITSPAGLDVRVQAEIKRVLGTSGTVYMLGGTLALPQAIENQLLGLGYSVNRIWGNTHFDTAIAIDQQITGAPKTAIIATGINYYDALAAGAAAGANPDTVIVLTNGDNMPASSANYLNSLNPDPNSGTLMVTGGGPGDRALRSAFQNGQMPSWPSNIQYASLIGQNEKDTALLLANFFFAAPAVMAVATNRGWQDALTGGAMIGANYGPLLITDPNALYGPLSDYLSRNSGGMWDGVMLGGYLALPDALINPIGDAISLPGQWTYSSFEPINPSAGGRSVAPRNRAMPTGIAGKTAGQHPAGATPPGRSHTPLHTVKR